MARMPLHVSLLYGGLTALLVTILGMNVSRLRSRHGAGLGAPIPPELLRPHRAHGNATEWTPLWLALLVALEASGRVSDLWLHLFGGVFLFARVLHAGGLIGKNKASVAGAALTYLVLLAMGARAVILGLSK